MKKLLNEGWMFAKEGASPRLLNLPHDAMLEEVRDPKCLNGLNSGFFPGGKYTYEKELEFTKEDLDKEISILFEGVYQNAKVFVNDNLALTHGYGYSEFLANITNFIKEGKNQIRVEVDNSKEPNCRWYSGSGIYRDVTLFIYEKEHPTYLKIKTISINPNEIEVETDATSIRILDGEKEIYLGKPGRIALENTKVWDLDNPNLYRCVAKKGNEEIEESFGIRTISVSSKTGFLLNEKRVLLRGGCIHHDNGILGAVSIKEAEYRKVRILKESGYNAIRCAHNACSRHFLKACDELGMLVLDEAFDSWFMPKTYNDYARLFEDNWKDDLKAMINKDYNHPSVIMYSIGNEICEISTEKGIEVTKEMVSLIKSIDDTRPVTSGINVMLNVLARFGLGVYKEKKGKEIKENQIKKMVDKKVGSAFFNSLQQKFGVWTRFVARGRRGDKALEAAKYLDVTGLNYAESRYLVDQKKYPNRVMVGAETMIADLPKNWEIVKKYPAVIGDFCWTSWDYLGEACMGEWGYKSNSGLPLLAGCGAIDITGKVTAENVFSRIVWGLYDSPYIGVRPINHNKEMPNKTAWRFTNVVSSWNWKDYLGEKAMIEVFSKGSRVRLELNSKVIGEKKLKGFRAFFKTKYEPGILTAIALDENGNEISRSSLRSGSNFKLTASFEEDNLVEGSLCHLNIAIQDENGSCLTYREDEVTIEGTGFELVGLGNANPRSDETYLDNVHHLYEGHALGIIRITDIKNLHVRVKANAEIAELN